MSLDFFNNTDDALPILDYVGTWTLLVVSGYFFTVGSCFFVRAFEEPAPEPLFKNWKHFRSDELTGAWCFLLGTVPFVPYTIIFWSLAPGQIIYIGAVIVSLIFVACTYLFVLACYPTETVRTVLSASPTHIFRNIDRSSNLLPEKSLDIIIVLLNTFRTIGWLACGFALLVPCCVVSVPLQCLETLFLGVMSMKNLCIVLGIF